MRNISLGFLVVALASGSVFAKPALPFIGTKNFNLMGGNGTEQSITIKRDGTAKIVMHGMGGGEVQYSGRFSYSGMRDQTDPSQGWLLKNGKIYQTENGRISTGCQGDYSVPCVSDLY